jgi:uncharacterized membrane protein
MWFVGLLIGLVLGAAVDGGEGAFVGAALGAAAGMVVSLLRRGTAPHGLEARVSALEAAVQDLRRQLAGASMAGADAPREEPAPAALLTPPPETTSQTLPAPELLLSETAAAPPPQPVASAASTPPTQAVPDAFERFWRWLTGGNALVRVGVVVLFFGVAFLLKYAYEHTHLPIELRLAAVALGACAMLAIGWRLRATRPVYALAMQGGGVGVLYLTVFGAFRLFGLLPGEAAFVVLIAVAVLSALLAVLQNALSLAVLGVAGGFLAPVLASTGQGSHVLLFSYYTVLNLGILGIAFYKAWRPLNVVGFVFTFGIGTLWGARFYRPDLFASTEPFLLIFFLMYVAIAVIFAFRQAPQLRHYVDATVVFGTPLIGFGLQARLVSGFEYGAAWSALGAAALYLGLAAVLYRSHRETLRMLVEAFLALGVIFVTLAIPLAVDGRWTAGAWALEGAAAYWVGVRQNRKLVRAFGLLLQFAAGAAFLADLRADYAVVPVLNSFWIGTALIAVSALFSNRTIERHAAQVGHFAMQVAIIVFLWGVAWWVFGGLHEIQRHVPVAERLNAALLFLGATCLVFSELFVRGWWIARFPALALPPVMAVILLMQLAHSGQAHPLAGYGVLAWPLAFLFHFRILRRDHTVRTVQVDRQVPEIRYLPFAHAAGVWLLAATLAWEAAWQIDRIVEGRAVWPLIAWGLVPAALLGALSHQAARAGWLQRDLNAYLWLGAAPLAAFLWGCLLFANAASNGDPAPLVYLPLLNPLDIAQLIGLGALITWWRSAGEHGIDGPRRMPAAWSWGLFGVAAFVWLNGVLLRSLYHWGGVAYDLESILRSDLAQTAVSVFWTVLALASMVFATRRGYRALWLTGAALMAVVVVKLFLVDLAKVGGVERIVSFIAVGILMLVIGYVSPVPPRKRAQEE